MGLKTHPGIRRRPTAKTSLRRIRVRVPSGTPGSDAIFILMRRMRGPLVLLIMVFAIDVAGLAIIPGVDANGNPYHMTVFEAFYFMSYTATTIGYGELPSTFTTPQRLWVTFSIYSSVLGWAYTFGALFGLLQDNSFKDALTLQRFARKVRALREPFLIVAGFGQMGQAVTQALDEQGRRLVVIDTHGTNLAGLAGGKFNVDVPGIEGDATNPEVLGVAGLGHPYCEGLLAMTNDDQVNLSIVMAVQLLAPEVPVIARSNDRDTVGAMHDFRAEAVINPYDRYGAYLQLRLQEPATYQLATWLMAPYDAPPPERIEGLRDGPWVVVADDHFGTEIADDLSAAGLQVTLYDGTSGCPDVRDAVGFVAGGRVDARNLSMAAHARLAKNDLFISLRQSSTVTAPLLKAFNPESVFIPSQLTTQEALARVTTPDFWTFIEFAVRQRDDWSEDLLARLQERLGTGSPASAHVRIDLEQAPAAVMWLRRGHDLRLGDLFRDPHDREQFVEAMPLALWRAGKALFLPDDGVELRENDDLLVVGRYAAFDIISQTVFHESSVEYVATGNEVPSSWLFRLLSPRVSR